MERIDLSTNAKEIGSAYHSVVDGDSTYVVYSVDSSSTLTVDTVGDGDLETFIDHFNEGSIQFGLAKVTVPGSNVSKNLLLGWCPDSSPTKSRLSFASNFADVAKILSGYHVQITARDQDDLDVSEFNSRVAAAAGARYDNSSNVASSKGLVKVAPPSVAKLKPKPLFIPKSTGAPVGKSDDSSKPKGNGFSKSDDNNSSKPKGNGFSKSDDGWGDEKEIEERDFDKNPLSNTPSSYKPTKVNIDELRKNKSDTISSKNEKKQEKETESSSNDNDSKPQVSNLLNKFDKIDKEAKKDESNYDSTGRLTSLPKHKVTNSVASRFTPSSDSSSSNTAKFGSKPIVASKPKSKDGLVGGLSRNFGAEGGKTPAQIWAEKRGQYKVVDQNDDDSAEPAESKNDSEEEEEDKEEEQPKPKFIAFDIKRETRNVPNAPSRTLPPPPARQAESEEEEEEQEDDKEEKEEEEQPKPKFVALDFKREIREVPDSTPARTLPPPPNQAPEEEEEEEEEETTAPSLPSRSQESPAPSLPTRSEDSKPKGPSAVAEYDYEKDDDNEIGFEEGDKIIEIEFTDEEWWTGKNVKTGEVGLFPAAYVVLDDKKESTKESKEQSSTSAPAAAAKEESKGGASATAEFDYEKDEDNEISFAEGDSIVEIQFIDDDWWSGKHSKSGETGLFPANYVKLND